MELRGACALLTGAGGGIGRALAVDLAGKGVRLVLTGRSVGPLQDTRNALPACGAQAVVFPADVCDPLAQEAMLQATRHHFGRLDVLVHCAGLSVPSATADFASDRFDEQLQVNLLAPMALTRRALPDLLARPRSAVVNVLSGAALAPYPFLAAYSAAKAGLAAFGDALHRECCSRGLHVLNVYPGPTDTAMLRTSALRGAMADVEAPADLARAIGTAIEGGSRQLIRSSGTRARLIEAARKCPEMADSIFVDITAKLQSDLGSSP